jgi:hypothetical protein
MNRGLHIQVLRFLLILLLLFISGWGYSQETITIKGKVLDAETSKSVPFASIGIAGKPLGTVTNSDGNFEFSFSRSFFTDSLFVSNLGYFTYKIALKDIKNRNSFFIVLQPRVYNMTEVEITPDGTDAYLIVKKACDSLCKNTPAFAYLSDGFYREYISENGSWARAIEASLSVYNDGKQHIGDYFFPAKLNGIRISKDFLSSFSHSENVNQISLFLTSTMDIKWFVMSINSMKFKVDSMIYLDDKLIWVISGTPEQTKKKAYYKYEYSKDRNTGKVIRIKKKYTYETEKNSDFFFRYRYYITDGDFAFVKVEYNDTTYKPDLKEELKTYSGLYISYTTTRKTLEFTKYAKLWFPKFLSEFKEIAYYRRPDSSLFINLVKQSDFMISSYQTELVTEIPQSQEIKMYKDIYKQGYVFDPFYWANYNKIVDDELRNNVFLDLRLAELERDTSSHDLYLALKDSIEKSQIEAQVVNITAEKDTLQSDVNETVVNDLIFKVQILAVSAELKENDPAFKNLQGVEMYFHKGLYKYTYGNISSMNDAQELLKHLQSVGFSDAFIVPFYKGDRISIIEAVEMLNSH